ncbi:unnamed protein product [Mytilus coruscus]|uniref:Uncharacterized protein n=1 Tax=Mytilus coruscus TaxID=42192 RepID=A0A6J8A6Q0_MYTCO|nr:unnamed protein product [Mytilus coruscus]
MFSFLLDFGSCSSEIELTIEQREQHDGPTYNLYCKSRKKPFDDSAEFQVDGFSREHILIIQNRCFDRKKQECSFDYCECDPTVNGFTVKLKMNYLKVGQTFGCLIRFRNNATGNFLKMFTSNKFNGTDFIPDECNVKVIGTTSNSSSPTVSGIHMPKQLVCPAVKLTASKYIVKGSTMFFASDVLYNMNNHTSGY